MYEHLTKKVTNFESNKNAKIFLKNHEKKEPAKNRAFAVLQNCISDLHYHTL